MQVTLRYFGVLRDATGNASETLELPPGCATTGALVEHLAASGRFGDLAQHASGWHLAVNQRVAGRELPLQEGDDIALFCAICGG